MLSIGELAQTTGCKVETIRYYEKIGLMPEPERTGGNQRRYAPRHRERLHFIRHSRDLGFSIEAIRELLALSDQQQRDCAAVDALARRHREAVQARIESLLTLREELDRMIEGCAGGDVAHCRIIEVLSDHSQCQGEHG
ncbi:MerR family transcriptional regulator [Alcanivorax hongdengensis A-11-3]|uniref:MerR family transcriptional regulator n=1 Tax=Alcanivorax hongdengensis A-11-3 TaxID=1177179 RepID=L0WG33_9GAMM|nr:helix-turn-helix domain-containing protein [Alcanivorax hongdengensis]EKF74785.1 MerR family transcriptional regulator [Alcanivorax hongdengensis A-11-3]